MSNTFNPPQHYAFEQELQGPTPREVPRELALSADERKARRVTIIAIMMGVLLMAISPLPQVAFLAQFILPLEYLLWIGLGIVVIGGIGLIRTHFQPQRNLYIRDGQPVIAHILSIVKRVTTQVEIMSHVITFEFRHPFYEEVHQQQITTDQSKFPFKAGDYVTALYLPDAVNGVPLLYPLLGFRRDDSNSEFSEVVHAVAKMMMVISFIALPLLVLFAIFRWMIRDEMTAVWIFFVGAAVVGIPVCILTHWLHRRSIQQREDRNAMAELEGGIIEEALPQKPGFLGLGYGTGILALFGFILLCGALGLGIALALNGVLDTSPPKPIPVMIVGLSTTTHNFIIREYEVAYAFENDPDTHKIHTTQETILQFRLNRKANLITRSGYFGWEWIEDIQKN